MKHTYFKTDFESSLSGLVPTDEAIGTLMPFNPYGVWLFGVDSSSLVDASGKGNVLTVVDDKTTYPQDAVTFSDNSIGIINLVGKYLSTGISDTESVTIIGVAKYTHSSGVALLAGNLTRTADAQKSSWGVFTTGDNPYITLRSPSPNSSTISSRTTEQTLTVNDYFMYAISINKITDEVILYIQNDGVESHLTSILRNGYLGSGDEVVIGNINYTGDLTPDINSHAETTIYKKALTLDEIKVAASYVVARCADRGTDI